MAIPSYTTDLRIVANAEALTADPGTWAELTGHIAGGAQTDETDYYIQGTHCVSQSTGGKTGTLIGLQYDYGSTLTWGTGYCIFAWMIYLAANGIATWANGGIRLGIGSSSGNMRYWNAIGSDFGKYPYGGWQNVAVDPVAWWASPDGTDDGTPVANTFRVIGSLPNMTSAVSKGNPHAMDTIRYGRGEIQITGGSSTDGYGIFSGITVLNDSSTNRWGLFQKEGTGYLWKGLLSFGTSGATGKICNFLDSNVNITIENTPRTYADFNKIEINQTGTTVSWTAVNFTTLLATQLSRGSLLMVDNAVVTLNTCVFTDMNTFIFKSNASLTNCTWRRCNQINQSGATFNGCTFANSTSTTTLLTDNIGLISNCDFTSDGSNYAMELTSAHAGGSYVLTNCTYSNYAATSGTTGNEVIYNNSGGAVTITINGGGVPSYRNAGASTTTILTAQVILTLSGMTNNTEVRIYRVSDSVQLAGIEDTSGGTFSYSYSYTGNVPVYIQIYSVGYIPILLYITLTDTSTTIPIQQQIDRWYSNP